MYLAKYVLGPIPPTTKILILPDDYNGSVDNLPEGIEHIVFGKEFNQPVDNLPKTVTHLYFGRNFNQSVDKLPENLIFLHLGYDFDRCIDNFPKGLKYLSIFDRFNKQIKTFPESIIYLSLGPRYHQSITLPKSLQCFRFDNAKLFSNIRYIRESIFGEYDYMITGIYNFKLPLQSLTDNGLVGPYGRSYNEEIMGVMDCYELVKFKMISMIPDGVMKRIEINKSNKRNKLISLRGLINVI